MNFNHPKEAMRAKILGLKPSCNTCKYFHGGTKTWCRKYRVRFDSPGYPGDPNPLCADFELKKQP